MSSDEDEERPVKKHRVSKSSDNDLNLNAASSTTSSIATPWQSKSKKSPPKPEYDEGMNCYPNPIQFPSDTTTSSTTSSSSVRLPSILSGLLYNLGLIHQQQHDDNVAVKFFEFALNVCKNDTDCSTPASQIPILHNLAYTSYRLKSYQTSLMLFTQLYHLCACVYTFKHVSVASTLNCIGVVLFHMRETRCEDVAEILDKSLSLRRELMQEGDDDGAEVATVLNNIGRVYFDSGDLEKAKGYYQQALSIRRKVLGNDHLDVSATSFNAGQTYHKLNILPEALSNYQEFHRITTSLMGSNHRDVVIVLKHIGQVYHEMNEWELALRYYGKGLDCSRRVLGFCNREAASILNMMGNLHYESGDFDKAIQVYEKGLSIERIVLEKKCVNIVVTLSNIGQAMMQKGDYQPALAKYSEAYSIQRALPGKDKSVKKIAETLSIIGQIASILGKFNQAQKAFSKVVALRKKTLGNHIDVALALNYLGLVYFKQGALDLAMENFEESLS
eukprot:scaffold14644_cov310-Alexandrium_tamarense.AAC.1